MLKIDPIKDRQRRIARSSAAVGYATWAIVAIAATGSAASVFLWRDGVAPVARAADPLPPPVPQLVVNPQSEREITRLNDAVRALAAERDRLANRVDQLERSVGDITASITKPKQPPAPVENLEPPKAPPVPVEEPPAAATQPARTLPPSAEAPPAPSPDRLVLPESPPNPPQREEPPSRLAMRQAPPPETTNTQTRFAIDLGGEKTIDGLRARWASLKGNHGGALNGLRPIMSVKDGSKPGTVELRLVAGPFKNAADAARTCARLQATGVPCLPTVYDGQRLSLQ
jgi:type IV secretory pathway VirB10-like protein